MHEALLCLSNSIKKMNKLANADLKHLVNWINVNKISVNVKKNEMVIFKTKQNKFKADLKIKLFGKRLYPTESVKYLGVKINTNLSWQYHIHDLSIKLNGANALLFKMKKYVNLKILKPSILLFLTSMYPTVFFGLRIAAILLNVSLSLN